MKKLIFLIGFAYSLTIYAGGGTVGNGGDSIAIQFKDIGNTLVAQMRFAEKKKKLDINPEIFKKTLNEAIVESTNKKLILKGRRKDAINYPASQRIIIYATGWRQMSIQDKRTLVLHEILGLLKIDDSKYQISSNLESVTSVEIVPYFAGKDEQCFDPYDDHVLPGDIYDVRLVKIVVVSDIYTDTNSRETYCTVSVETPDKSLRRFSASFSDRCRMFFTQKKIRYKLRVVDDHICEILKQPAF